MTWPSGRSTAKGPTRADASTSSSAGRLRKLFLPVGSTPHARARSAVASPMPLLSSTGRPPAAGARRKRRAASLQWCSSRRVGTCDGHGRGRLIEKAIPKPWTGGSCTTMGIFSESSKSLFPPVIRSRFQGGPPANRRSSPRRRWRVRPGTFGVRLRLSPVECSASCSHHSNRSG